MVRVEKTSTFLWGKIETVDYKCNVEFFSVYFMLGTQF